MPGEFVRDRLWERDVSGLATFRQGQDELAPDDLDLTHDVQSPAEELEVIDREPEDFALPQPAPGGDGGGDPVPRRQRCVHIQHVLGGQGVTLRATRRGALTDAARHGFLAIRSSSTAAEKMAERLANSTRR